MEQPRRRDRKYLDKKYKNAISDYHRAAKLDKTSATYHTNLGMAYFESSDMDSARQQFAAALLLDPHAFDRRDSGGITAQIVGTQNYPQLCFEMAKLYARHKDDAATLLWLSKATRSRGIPTPRYARCRRTVLYRCI